MIRDHEFEKNKNKFKVGDEVLLVILGKNREITRWVGKIVWHELNSKLYELEKVPEKGSWTGRGNIICSESEIQLLKERRIN